MADIKAVLERARRYEIEVITQLEHIERLHRIMARAQKCPEYTMAMAEKLAWLEGMLNAQIDRAVDAKLEALDYISILEGEERGVIESYFLLGKTWEQIADSMYMSDRRVFLIRKKALERLERHFSAIKSRAEGKCYVAYKQNSEA